MHGPRFPSFVTLSHRVRRLSHFVAARISTLETPKHRFAIGQKVKFRSTIERLSFPDAIYEVVRHLPPLSTGATEVFQYMLKELSGAHFRTAREDHLDGDNV